MSDIEWLWDDTRLVIYDWFMIINLYNIYTETDNRFIPFHGMHDKVTTELLKDMAIVYVKGIPRTYKNRLRRDYWVVSFKSTHHATLFKLKYSHIL